MKNKLKVSGVLNTRQKCHTSPGKSHLFHKNVMNDINIHIKQLFSGLSEIFDILLFNKIVN